MNKFSKKTTDALKHYVYALVDPNNGEIFYVGKGQNNRPFDHFKPGHNIIDKDLNKKIKDIKSVGLEPRIEIIRFGLDNKTAHDVEAAVIDSIGLDKLTNSNKGEDSERGRDSIISLERRFGGAPIDVGTIKFPAILFYGHKAYDKKYDIYDSVRQFWGVSYKRVTKKIDGEYKYKYAFGMRGSIVLEIYKILEWYPAGTTITSRPFTGSVNEWEFIGSMADENIRKTYCNKIIYKDGVPLPANEKGFRYLE